MDRIEVFDVVVPAGTLKTAPISVLMPFDDGIVEGIEVAVPAGTSLLVGFQIRHSSESVFPRDPRRFVVRDGDTVKWVLTSPPPGSLWGCRAYNQGIYDHTLFFHFMIREYPRFDPSYRQPVAIEQDDQATPNGEEARPMEVNP